MKNVLITGASGGIGQALTDAFARNGWSVIGQYNRRKPAEKENCLFLQADVSREEDVKKMFSDAREARGRLDCVIVNAGVALNKMLCDTTLTEWRRVLDTNLTGAFLTAREALSDLMWQGGTLLFISSIWGQCGGACEAAYSASKAGMIGLAEALAKEYENVRVHCLCPGVIDTSMNGHLTTEEKKELAIEIPMGRFGRPEEVAQTCLFLASDEANGLTGTVFGINGGLL